MKINKTIPAVVVISLLTGWGFAHGSTSITKPSGSSIALPPGTDQDLMADRFDNRSDIAAIQAKIKKLRARLTALNAQKPSNPDRKEDIAAIQAKIKKLRARLTALNAQKPSNPDRKEDIAAIQAKIKKLRARLTALNAQKPSNPDRKEDIAAIQTKIKKLRARLTALERQKHFDPDRKEDIAAIRTRIARLKDRLKELRGENRPDFDRVDRDIRDHESPEASFHHDGDDQNDGLKRADLLRDHHMEATREIVQGSHQRIASLYSPSHQAGYHARMHRHHR